MGGGRLAGSGLRLHRGIPGLEASLSAIDVAVVGAGAAGLMAARFSAAGGATTLVLESTGDGGRKILVSGGGRCNVLPGAFQPERFVTASSPNLMRRMLRAWPLPEQRRYFEEHLGLPLALEVESGKLFPASNRARDVRDRLLAAARRDGVHVRFGARVSDVRVSDGVWRVTLSGGEQVLARRVILATGGLSVPRTGSDGFGLQVARKLGHRMNPTYPALTPLTADPPVHAGLAGVSLEVTLSAPGVRPRFSTRGGFLFTHRGYSGPAVLDASHLAVRSHMQGSARQPLRVSWAPLDRETWEERLLKGTGSVGGVVAAQVPNRLARVLVAEADVVWDQPLARLRRADRARLLVALTDYDLPWTGDEGYRKAEVTGGGVALDQVLPGTLESRVSPGLHLCGEMLDAFGPIGGHNFLWAWATGRTAGMGAARGASGR